MISHKNVNEQCLLRFLSTKLSPNLSTARWEDGHNVEEPLPFCHLHTRPSSEEYSKVAVVFVFAVFRNGRVVRNGHDCNRKFWIKIELCAIII